MQIRYSFIVIIVLTVLGSCRKDFDTIPSSGELGFSKDTVLLNRVFDAISSSTQSFKVYNKSNDAITIPTIKLGRGNLSFYRLNVDGIDGKSFENIEILANDSIFVFVEATVDFSQVTDKDFFYRDSVVFDSGGKQQDVDLEALVLDVHLIRPDRDLQADNTFIYEEIVLGKDAEGENISIRGSMLDGNTTFTNDKPYLIYGYVGVPKQATLDIDAGAILYFHKNSGIIVAKGATLTVNGTLDNEVLFEDDRLEPEFEDSAGQWGTIWLRAGSKNNSINYAIIKNSVIGILVDSLGNSKPTLTIKNTQIYNTTNFGILGRDTHIKGANVVVGNNGQSSLACTIGGKYDFTHCTFANYWERSFRQFPTVLVNNFFTYIDKDKQEITVASDLVKANFTNCIIDGNQNIEFVLDNVEEATFNYIIKNSMLRFNTTDDKLLKNPLFDFTNTTVYQNIVLNGDSDFKDTKENQLFIGQDSELIGKAEVGAAQQVPFDILQINRTASPDIGAYQHVIFEEDEN